MKRRDFLSHSKDLALASTYLYGLQTLWQTCLQQNLAKAATAATDLNYVNIQLPGAPPRWYFDQPLNPLNRGGDVITGLFGTEIQKVGTAFSPVLRSYKMDFGGKEVYLPPVWALKSAHHNRDFKELLDHTMMIRGVDMEINSHPVNQARIVRPVSSNPSITGLVADASSRPLPGVGHAAISGSNAFKSPKGISSINVDPNNPIPSLTASFSGNSVKSEDLTLNEKNALGLLDDYAVSKGLASQGGEKQQTAAFDMFARNLSAFNTRWATLLSKYKQIVNAEIKAAFPGITSVNPIGDNTELFRYNRNATNFVNGSLAAQIVTNTRHDRMAASFAFVEFALTENLSSAITVGATGSTMEALKDVGNLVADQHFVGSNTSIYYTSLMYRALLGCLMELINVLKAEGLFDHTLIHLMAEFSRTPKANGGGSDHGFNSGSTTMMSGMITTPGLVGNILKQAANPNTRTRYPGTWGEAADFFAEGGGRHLLNDDISTTLSTIMEVQKVAVKGQSLVRKTSGRIEWAQNWELKNV